MTFTPTKGQTRLNPGDENYNTGLALANRSGLVATKVPAQQGFGAYLTPNAQAVTVVVSSGGGGTGYSPADTITLTGGTCSAAVVLTVATTTSGGAVATVTISTSGTYSLIIPTSAATQATSSGAGITAKFNVTWGLQAATVSSAGSMFVKPATVTITSTAATASGFAYSTATMKAVGTPVTAGAGSGYAPADTVTLTGGTCATAIVLSITTTKMVGLSIGTNAGTGYAVNDTISLSGGTCTVGAVITVTATTSGGAVSTINITNNGTYSANTATPTQGTTSGSGTNATFINACYGALTVSISTAGSYTVMPSNAVLQGTTTGTGTNASFFVTWGINSVPVSTAGSGFTSTVGLVAANTVTTTGQGATGATTTEDNLYIYPLPGGSFTQVGDSVFVFAQGVVGNNGNTKTVKTYFGPRSFSLGASTSNGVSWWTQCEATMIAANVISTLFTGQIGGAAINPQVTEDFIATGQDISVRVTGTNGVAQPNDIICTTMAVEFEG